MFSYSEINFINFNFDICVQGNQITIATSDLKDLVQSNQQALNQILTAHDQVHFKTQNQIVFRIQIMINYRKPNY